MIGLRTSILLMLGLNILSSKGFPQTRTSTAVRNSSFGESETSEYLIRTCDATDEGRLHALGRYLEKHSPVDLAMLNKLLKGDNANVIRSATFSLKFVSKENYKAAIQCALKNLNDDSAGELALTSVLFLGVDQPEVIFDLARSSLSDERKIAVQLTEKSTTKCQIDVFERFLKAAKPHDSSEIRSQRAACFKVMSFSSSKLRNAIYELCRDECLEVRRQAIGGLFTDISSQRRDATQILLQALTDDDADISLTALNLIASCKDPSPELIQAVYAYFRRTSGRGSDVALRFLLSSSGPRQELTLLIKNGIASTNSLVRLAAFERIFEDTDPSLDITNLETFIQDDYIACCVASCLERSGRVNLSVQKVLLGELERLRLNKIDILIQSELLLALGASTKYDDSTILYIGSRIKDSDVRIRIAAAASMLRLRPNAEVARRCLVKELNRDDSGRIIEVVFKHVAPNVLEPITLALLADLSESTHLRTLRVLMGRSDLTLAVLSKIKALANNRQFTHQCEVNLVLYKNGLIDQTVFLTNLLVSLRSDDTAQRMFAVSFLNKCCTDLSLSEDSVRDLLRGECNMFLTECFYDHLRCKNSGRLSGSR